MVLREAPQRAGLVFCWPYFRLYLLNLVWAIPVIPFVDDWTWMGLVQVTAACAGVGFVMGFLASVIYWLTAGAGPLRGWLALLLAAPSCVLPILCVVQDGPEMLALAWRYHLISGWLIVMTTYLLAAACIGFLRNPPADRFVAPEDDVTRSPLGE